MVERVSGYPNPKLYDQFYINKYSFPKGLQVVRKQEDQLKDRRAYKQSLYDLKQPRVRKGIAGWKLTKRPNDWIATQGAAKPQSQPRLPQSATRPMSDFLERRYSSLRRLRKNQD